MRQLAFLLRQVQYDLDTSLLFRPAVLLVVYAAAGLALPWAEAALDLHVKALATEPATATAMLSTLAGAIMTVVSMVYSVLLVALSLISMQFSTRILAVFIRDRLNRTVLGLFVGTFTYCLLVLQSVRNDPPWVPEISLAIALVLAIICLASMVVFINHTIINIQANVLVDRLAGEAEEVILAVFPAERVQEPARAPTPAHTLAAPKSGYIQLFNIEELRVLAKGRIVHAARQAGAFVAKGTPLFFLSEAPDATTRDALLSCVDIGAMRTPQDDAEIGVRRIVDIALKALSPAVNDPSTAATCVDHLGRLVLLAASRGEPQECFDAEGGQLYVPSTCAVQMLDLAVDQIRQYARTDMAIALRLLRLLTDLALQVRDEALVARVHHHARLIVSAANASFDPAELEELGRRYAALLAVAGAPESA